MKRQLALVAIILGTGALEAGAQITTPLFQENFDSLTLGPSVNERQLPEATNKTVSPSLPWTKSIPNAFTHTPPAGWTQHPNFDNFGHVDLDNPNYTPENIVGNIGIGNQGDPGSGVDEWEGWSFASFDFWLLADQQGRANFLSANNSTIAVVDPDEYDDVGGGLGGAYYNAGMSTNDINVAGKSSVNFSFDSSWQAEGRDDLHTQNPALAGLRVNNQTAVIYASFDGAEPVRVDLWHSDSTLEGFKATLNDERLTYPINVPVGAQNMKITLAMLNAGNDWWWAVDNLAVDDGGAPFWTEDFESLPLGPSVNEVYTRHTTTSSSDPNSTPLPNAFTHTPPEGWTTENLFTPPADDDIGVFEWENWTFTTKEFSTFARNTQLYSFHKSTGNYAIADSDAYAPMGGSTLDVVMTTPAFNIAGTAANELMLQFDSAWQTSGAQQAAITVDYGSGEVEVLRWSSDGSDPNFHPTSLNETVLLALNNPANATTAQLRFKYEFGSNNWFWAVDNIKVGVAGDSADFNGDGKIDGNDFLVWQQNLGSGTTFAQGDADGNGTVDSADLAVWRSQFGNSGASAAAGAVPEPAGFVLAGVALAALGACRRRA